MEYRSIGVMGVGIKNGTPKLQYSNTPEVFGYAEEII
jgi:hypothetical protein